MDQISLRADKVKKNFNVYCENLEVLKGISYTFLQGKAYGISGESGSGKSTLLHILAGLDTPSSGLVYFNNSNIARYHSIQKKELLNKYFGLAFQKPYLIAELSVIENVMLKGLIEGKNQAECTERADNFLHQIGLYDKKNKLPLSLSGGQQQQIAILRALFNKPIFLLADEPTGNLDKKAREVILELLLKCKQDWNMGLIISSHDPYVIERMETTLYLNNGLLIDYVNKGEHV